jgi:hypothetical protein
MEYYQRYDSQDNSEKSFSGNYFWVLILVPVIFGLIWLVPYLIEQEAIKSKIRDYEIQSYLISSKKVEPETKTEYYNCVTTSLSLPLTITAEAAKTSGRSSPKVSNPSTPSKSTGNSNTSSWYTPKDTTNNFKSDSLKQNPVKTGDNSNLNNTNFGGIFGSTRGSRNNNAKTTRCQERYYTVYNYVMDDSGGDRHYFGFNLGSANQNPNGWNDWQIGDPVAKIKEYENYFLSGIDPIFSPTQTETLTYSKQIPDEPKTYGTFDLKVDQVWQFSENIFADFSSDEMKYFNQELMKVNSFLNAKPQSKQVNVRLFLVPDNYDDYLRQLCIKWKGCNKNDLIFTIQLTKEKQIARVQGYSWSPTGYDIAIDLDSDLVAAKTNLKDQKDFDSVLSQIKTKTNSKFIRQEMSEYRYIREALERQVKRERAK